MKLKFQIVYYPNKIGVIHLFGELDHHATEKIRNQLSTAIIHGELQTLIWNMQNVAFMDSSAIGLILGRFKELRTMNGKVLIINPNATMEKIFQFSGLMPFIYKGTEQEALQFVGGNVYG